MTGSVSHSGSVFRWSKEEAVPTSGGGPGRLGRPLPLTASRRSGSKAGLGLELGGVQGKSPRRVCSGKSLAEGTGLGTGPLPAPVTALKVMVIIMSIFITVMILGCFKKIEV